MIDENATFSDDGDIADWSISNGTKTTPADSWVRNTKVTAAGAGSSSILSRTVSYPAAGKDFIVYGRTRAKNANSCFSVVWLLSGSKSLSIWFGSADAATATTGAVSIRGSYGGQLYVAQVASGLDYENDPIEFALHFDSKFNTLNCYFMRDGQPPEFRGRVRCEAFQAPTIQTVTGSMAPAGTWIEHDYLMVCRPNIIGIGDSIEDGRMGFSADPSLNATNGQSNWRAYANVLSGLRNRLIVNKGVPGNTSAQISTRIQSDAIENGPRIVVVGCSNNDYYNGVSSLERTANVQTTVSAVAASGAKCVLRNSVYGGQTPVVAGSLITDGSYLAYHRTWWEDYSASIVGVDALCDLSGMLSPEGGYVCAGLLGADGVHPVADGYSIIGHQVSELIETLEYDEVPEVPSDTDMLFVGVGTANANSIPGDPAHIFEVTNDNSGKQCVRINSYGASSYGNNVHFCRYFGTQASPSAIGSGAFLMSTGYRGHDGSGLSQSMAAFQVVATENWTPTAHGIRFQWQVTPKGSSIRKHMMELDAYSLNLFGNIGLGKAPAAWHSNYRALELGTSGTAIRGHATDAELTLTSNAYYDSTGYKRGQEDGAAYYQMVGGRHVFGVSQLAAAGSSISFKAALQINNDGRAYLYGDAQGYSASAATLSVGKSSATGRSINAAGTVNVSGADYAEYIRKSPGCGILAKGDVVGIDANGELTDKWSGAISFAIKSSDPGMVGGDTEVRNAEPDQYDRVAFCGQVPVNASAKPGDYLVPAREGDRIAVSAVASPSLDDYRVAVGRVLRIGDDGRPVVAVRVG